MADRITKSDYFMASLGVECYRVGGSVRDELLGIKPKDADYVVRGVGLDELGEILRETSAKVLPLVLRDGQQGGYRVFYKNVEIEIMLPRTEVSTGPRHQDFKLIIDPDLPLEVDAERRDFTFNALYYDISDTLDDLRLHDPLGCGVEDLRRRRINVTHPDSFRDDPLRMLRALRFISVLGYELGAETRALMHVHADAATGLTAEGHASGTVMAELVKLLMGHNPHGALRVARDTGVLAVAFPELAPMLGFDQGSRYHDMTTDEHVFTALETAAHVEAPLRVRMALLFHDSGKPESAWVGDDGRKHYYAKPNVWRPYSKIGDKEVGGHFDAEDHADVGERLWREAALRLGAEKWLREDVATLIRNHMVECMKVNPVKVRRERVRLGDDILHDLYLMRICDLSGKGDKNMKFLSNVAGLEVERVKAEQAGVPTDVKSLEISGFDLRKLGVEGRSVGRVLRGVLDEVVCDPTPQKLTHEWQLSAAERLA
jgi:tRNA nucleotidyltransferase (CCA-adding enzyme)